MKRMTKSIVALLGLSIILGCTSDIPESDNTAFLREQGLDGKIALIEFGQIGCEVSHEGLITMQRMHAKNEIAGLNYLRIEASKDSAKSKGYLEENSVTIPVHYDPATTMARSFKATSYPCFVLVGKAGRVRYRGSFPPEELADWVQSLSEERGDPGADIAMFGAVELNIPELLSSTKLPDTSGIEPSPLSDYLGKNGIMVVFVDTECPFAGEAISQIPEIAKLLKGHDVPVVLINIDQEAKTVTEFYAKTETGTAVIYDTTTTTHKKWDVSSVPTVALISSNQKLLYKGPAVWEKVSSALETSMGLTAKTISFSEKGTEYG